MYLKTTGLEVMDNEKRKKGKSQLEEQERRECEKSQEDITSVD